VRDSNRKPAAGESQRGLEVYSPTQALAVGRKWVTPKKKSRQDGRDFLYV